MRLVVNTGPELGLFEVNYLDSTSPMAGNKQASLEKVLSMLVLAQRALPDQFISSNIAEVFNALHDHFKDYWG